MEDEEEELIDDQLPSAMLNNSITNAESVDVASHLRGILEAPEESPG